MGGGEGTGGGGGWGAGVPFLMGGVCVCVAFFRGYRLF